MDQAEQERLIEHVEIIKRNAAVVRSGLRVLSTRVLTLVGILLDSAMFSFAVYRADALSIAAAALFAIAVFMMVRGIEIGRPDTKRDE